MTPEEQAERRFLTGDVDHMTDEDFIALLTVVLRDTPRNRKKELREELWVVLAPIAGKFVPARRLDDHRLQVRCVRQDLGELYCSRDVGDRSLPARFNRQGRQQGGVLGGLHGEAPA